MPKRKLLFFSQWKIHGTKTGLVCKLGNWIGGWELPFLVSSVSFVSVNF